jgi:hypothetical protein
MYIYINININIYIYIYIYVYIYTYGNGGGGGISYLHLQVERSVTANGRAQGRNSAIKALPGVLASVFVLLYQDTSKLVNLGCTW